MNTHVKEGATHPLLRLRSFAPHAGALLRSMDLLFWDEENHPLWDVIAASEFVNTC